MKKSQLVLGISLLLWTLQASSQNWYSIPSGTGKNLNTISFPSPSVGYIGGDDSLLLKTTDGGLTWNAISFTGVSFFPQNSDILNLQFVTDNIGFMTLGPYASAYKTIDGGLTWTTILLQGNNCFNQGMFFFDPDNGCIGGSGCFQGELIERLNNGIWSSATMNSSTWNSSNLIVDIDFYNFQFGLAASAGGLIFRTIDGGSTWDSIPVTSTMNPLTSVLIVNDTLAYAGYTSLNVGFGLYISTDGGLTWNDDLNSATFFYPDFLTLHRSGNGAVYAGGVSQSSQTGLIFRSPGDGVTWNYDLVAQKVNDVSSYNDSIVFAVGDSGAIYVNKILSTQSVFENPTQTITFDIFPNPAHQFIQLTLPEGFITNEAIASIYTISGQLLARSTYSSLVDIRTFSPGNYILEIQHQKKRAVGKFVIE